MKTANTHTHTGSDSDALTIVETAAFLSVTTRTVWRYLAAGRLTALRHPLNRRVYVCAAEARAAREEMRRRWENRYGKLPEDTAE